MNLCEDDHDEVCYEGRNCPACAMKQQFSTAEDTILQLREELNDTNDALSDARKEIEDLKSQIE